MLPKLQNIELLPGENFDFRRLADLDMVKTRWTFEFNSMPGFDYEQIQDVNLMLANYCSCDRDNIDSIIHTVCNEKALDAMFLPSGENATPSTGLVWPMRWVNGFASICIP